MIEFDWFIYLFLDQRNFDPEMHIFGTATPRCHMGEERNAGGCEVRVVFIKWSLENIVIAKKKQQEQFDSLEIK